MKYGVSIMKYRYRTLIAIAIVLILLVPLPGQADSQHDGDRPIALRAAEILTEDQSAPAAALTAPLAEVFVTNTNDSGPKSLRQAILDANATSGLEKVLFNIPGSGPHVIRLASPLPRVTDPLIIDGTTEPDYAGGPIIVLDGSGAGPGASGLEISGGNSVVRGLVINGFDGNGIQLIDVGNNVIQGNYIGTDVTGTVAAGNGGAGVHILGPDNKVGGKTVAARNLISGNRIGVHIFEGSTGNEVQGNYVGTNKDGTSALSNRWGVVIEDAPANLIGGTTAGVGNLISGNERDGIFIYNPDAQFNRVEGNLIGTDFSGAGPLRNGTNGVVILDDASENVIGGTAAAARNVISSNGTSVTLGNGILIGNGAAKNRVEGNYIGVDLTGTSALGNTFNGVYVDGGAPDNVIGGTVSGAGNLISGNLRNGVRIDGTGTTGTLVQGNFIGTDRDGTTAIGNEIRGVMIRGAPNNVIGGTTPGARNVISGNNHGIWIQDDTATGNRVQGNYIGLDVTGNAPLGNVRMGILVEGAPNNEIGGTAAGAGNVISANGEKGVRIFGSAGSNNRVQGNLIGTNAAGTAALGNGQAGVLLFEAPDNLVGGTSPEARNVISANDQAGVDFLGSGATGNRVQGNYIGVDITGTVGLGNGRPGVSLSGSASGNLIGGSASGAGNVISSNPIGVDIFAPGNTVQGNFIGTNAAGSAALGNMHSGVRISGVTGTTVGGPAPGAGNLISGNGWDGVEIRGSGAMSNTVQGNLIGTDAAVSTILGNGRGVLIWDGSDNFIGGPGVGEGNVIAGNGHGVHIGGGSASDNLIQGNHIGTDAAGTAALGNRAMGVYISGDASGNTIGGTAAGAGNTIAFNGQNGIFVDSGIGNAIRANVIYSNTAIPGFAIAAGLGIDLRPGGVTPNDDGDADTGANNLQNFPVFTFATTSAGSTTISGTLNSTAGTTFTLEFFSNTACDPSNHGEGETFLGSTDVTTDGSGNTSFTITFPIAVPDGHFITATATDPGGNTSEFSECIVVPDSDADGVRDDVEDGAPNAGDGNNDGTPDRLQANVASLPNTVDGGYVTLASSAGTRLANVRAIENPSPGDAPPEADFPVGFFEFRVTGVPSGGSTTVTLFLPDDVPVSTYYKYGPTPGDPADHWYEFLFDGTTGAEILDLDGDGFTDQIVLHFVDGGRGDHDLTANGEIVDPGAPASVATPGSCPDYNSEAGVVDLGDLQHLALQWHQPPPPPLYYDCDDDGEITAVDLICVAKILGDSCGSAP